MTTSLPVNLKHAKDIHSDIDFPLLNDLVDAERALWTPAELQGLTSAVARDLTAPLLGILRYDSRRRWWARLALTMGVELWLLSWTPGQGTVPHDHGGACGSFTVLLGALEEDYIYPNGRVRGAVRTAGSTVAFGPDRAHRLYNGSGHQAASVHAYSPPLRPMREYRALTDFAGV
ncbi:cysteine dioxygenase [Nocardia sp. NPDC057030]|uniref:cysteine dioxygenase n=1 Tax=unclassified Nocardia TaxID=2637762 RepID=UPI0036269037